MFLEAKACNRDHWTEVKVLALSLEAQGGIHSLSLPATGGCWCSSAHGHITPISASVAALPSLSVSNLPPLLSYED